MSLDDRLRHGFDDINDPRLDLFRYVWCVLIKSYLENRTSWKPVRVRIRGAKQAWLAPEDENKEHVVTEAVRHHPEMAALMSSAPLVARIAEMGGTMTVLFPQSLDGVGFLS